MKKAKLYFMQEELVQSPGRTAMRNFFKRRLSIVGMCVFLFIFVACFSLSFILPIDEANTDSTRKSLPPSMNYLNIPKELVNNVRDISFGSTFGAGIDRNGKLYQWGTMTDTSAKVANIPANLPPLKMITCGMDHVAAVAEDGTVYAWGNDRLKITDIASSIKGKNVVDIQAGFQSTVALDDTGKLHFWGNASMFSFKPEYDDQGTFTAFAINITTAIALKNDKTVVCLSSADTYFKNIPESIQGHVTGVASTDAVCAAILEDHTVAVWGSTLAPAYKIPEHIQGHVVDLKGGRAHFTALLDDGSVQSWGDNTFGQTNEPRIEGYNKIDVNFYQSAAVDANGHAVAWGQKGYLMGTDGFGRDVFTRLIYGGRITLTVGFIAVIISTVIGVIIGGLSGYFGGKTDMFLMRFAEVVGSIPQIPLLMILAAIIQTRVSQTGRIIFVMVLLGVLTWPSLARLTRAQILAEKENEFVTAAKAMGIRERVIIFRHIIPNVMPVILVNVTLSLATCLLIESSLSFLGFGVTEPTPTWGNMLNACVSSTVIKKYPWQWIFPSLALGLTTISINIIGDGLRDAIDPKSNER